MNNLLEVINHLKSIKDLNEMGLVTFDCEDNYALLTSSIEKLEKMRTEEALTECYVPTGDDSGHLQVCKWLPTLKQWIPIEGVKRIKLPSPAVSLNWDDVLTEVPIRVHPMTENYFKNKFTIQSK